MKNLVIVLCIVALLIADASCQKPKRKRIRHGNKKEIPPTVETEIVESQQTQTVDEAALRAREELDAKLRAIERAENNEINPENTETEIIPDPCENKRCGPGRECVATVSGARCACVKKCPSEADYRRRVCSNYNETWDSDCELYRARCLCAEEQEECKNDLNKHLHIEYYGECRDMPTCTEEELSDFPRRMREWLFNVMRELADRKELSPHYLKMEREAERSTSESQRSVTAAVWKWCDLDGHPHDKVVSRHELFPIRAPLMALEHCIAPFLDSCDVDNDHRITLTEWGACLQIDAKELDDGCETIREGLDNEAEVDEEI